MDECLWLKTLIDVQNVKYAREWAVSWSSLPWSFAQISLET